MVMCLYAAFAVAGGAIVDEVDGSGSGVVVGGVAGSIVGYALMVATLKILKRRS